MGWDHIKTKLAQLKSPRPKQRKRTHWSLFIKTSPFLVNIKRRKSNTATSSSAKPSAYKYLLSSALTAPPSLSLFRLLALRVCVCVSLSLSQFFVWNDPRVWASMLVYQDLLTGTLSPNYLLLLLLRWFRSVFCIWSCIV